MPNPIIKKTLAYSYPLFINSLFQKFSSVGLSENILASQFPQILKINKKNGFKKYFRHCQ
jgi:hypothetical protein